MHQTKVTNNNCFGNSINFILWGQPHKTGLSSGDSKVLKRGLDRLPRLVSLLTPYSEDLKELSFMWNFIGLHIMRK